MVQRSSLGFGFIIEDHLRFARRTSDSVVHTYVVERAFIGRYAVPGLQRHLNSTISINIDSIK